MCKWLGGVRDWGWGWGVEGVGADARGKEVQGLGGIRRVGGYKGWGGGVQGVWEYNWLVGGGGGGIRGWDV